LQEAQRELDRLRLQEREYQRQLIALEAEREDYHRALTAAVRDQFPVIDDETALALIAEAETSGVNSAEVLRQIDAICRSGPAGGAHALSTGERGADGTVIQRRCQGKKGR
jgi:hypothetical protein